MSGTTPTGPAENCFLPNFCGTRAVFLLVLIGELLALVLTLAASAYSLDFWGDLAFASLYVQWVALGSAAALCLSRRWLAGLGTRGAAAAAFALTLGVNALCSGLTLWATGAGWVPVAFGDAGGPAFLARNLAIGAIVAVVAFRYFYVQYQWKRNTEAEARSRIQALQARIRPHFLFNSMNTIASLTRSRPELAEQAIEDLADVFRAALGGPERITLAQELEIVRHYLNIEALRLGPRLELQWSVGPEVPMDAGLPALTLQPLVENAIYHGIEPRTEGGKVCIGVERRADALVLSVENPLPDARSGHQHGNRMAQENIRQRLALAYGDAAGMSIREADGRYRVDLRIPLEAKP